jgi:glycosyltransferase involved in cell wall biosynthesis
MTTDAPTVSVVMSVRDGARYLRAAVDSILAQTNRDFEFVVVDDGSADATPSILQTYASADPRLRILSGAGRGIVSALTQGIAAARGRLIARMDSDDIALPTRLQRQVAFLNARSDILAVGSAIQIIDAADKPRAVRTFPSDPEAIARDLLRYNAPAHPTVVMRRDAFLQAGGYREALRHAEDYDLWLRMSERGGLANLPDVLLFYREHETQVTRYSRSASWLANALARDLADRRLRGLPEGLVADADLPTCGRAALERHLQPTAALDSERARIVLLMAESLAELELAARPLARAAIRRVLRFSLAGLDLRIMLKALRGYWRTSLLRRPAASAHESL